jgi:hypothetical protein
MVTKNSHDVPLIFCLFVAKQNCFKLKRVVTDFQVAIHKAVGKCLAKCYYYRLQVSLYAMLVSKNLDLRINK